MHETLLLAQELIRRPSLSPRDEGCQRLISQVLEPVGFTLEPMPFDDTENLWARHGYEAPLFCFAGHTDVVPVGNVQRWDHPPFEGVISDGMLHGRGSADMKGALAAMIIAARDFVTKHPKHRGSIAFLITSDEEGAFINGTKRVIENLKARQETMEYCLVGEPSSTDRLGDTIKIGRRGSLTGELHIHGIQGHVAYPQRARNPIHQALRALDELARHNWDQGNKHFQPTSLQITNISAGTGANNVIPAHLHVQFNLRYSTQQHHLEIQRFVHHLLEQHNFEFELQWTLSGEPFLTDHGVLLDATSQAIEAICGITPTPSTTGGTSDGRFIAAMGGEVLEFGPINATIHQVNERTNVEDLIQLTQVYQHILERILL